MDSNIIIKEIKEYLELLKELEKDSQQMTGRRTLYINQKMYSYDMIEKLLDQLQFELGIDNTKSNNL